jgi:hypothetical protein
VKTKASHSLILAGAIVFASCTFAEPPARRPSRTTLASFSGLAAGVTYEEIVRRVGPPEDEVGCCMYVYRYHLSDGSLVLVTSPDRMQILRVTHVVGDVETELLPNAN